MIFSPCCTLIEYREHNCKLLGDKKETFIAAIKENEGFIFKIAAVYNNNTDDKNDLVQEINN